MSDVRRTFAILFSAPFLLALAASSGCASDRDGAHVHEPSQKAQISARFLGRFDASDPAHVRFGFSASGATARFRGTRIDARLHDPTGQNSFQITIDGQPSAILNLQINQDSYTLASNLPVGEHEVAIEKRTEGRVGEVEFAGFDAPDGQLLEPPKPRARRIEFVGDSITAGYGNEGADEHCHYTPQTENEFITYGATTARALAADHTMVAKSGGTIDGVAELYDRAVPAHADSKWDPSLFSPDVIVVNLGTNDVTRGDQQPEFVQSYVKFLEHLRAVHPRALIACLVGSMLTDHYPPGKRTLTRARQYVHAAVAARKQVGDEKVLYLELPTQSPANGYGCDYHPSAKTHQLMAADLTAFLAKELGW